MTGAQRAENGAVMLTELPVATATLKQAINDVIDLFNAGCIIDNDTQMTLNLYSAKLASFTSSIYNINY